MAEAYVGVKLEGFEPIGRFFDRLDLFDKKALADFVGEEMHAITKEAFKSEKDPVSGEKWADLAASTVAKKAKKGENPAKLKQSVVLSRSTSYMAFPDGSVVQGSPMIYSRIHQEGGTAGRGRSVTIPQRRYMGLSEQAITRIYEDSAVKRILGFEE